MERLNTIVSRILFIDACFFLMHPQQTSISFLAFSPRIWLKIFPSSARSIADTVDHPRVHQRSIILVCTPIFSHSIRSLVENHCPAHDAEIPPSGCTYCTGNRLLNPTPVLGCSTIGTKSIDMAFHSVCFQLFLRISRS